MATTTAPKGANAKGFVKPSALVGGGGSAGFVRELLSLLLPSERRSLSLLLPAAVAAAVTEAAGVVSIIPFLGLLADPTIIERNPMLQWAWQASGVRTHESFFFVVGVGVLVLITVGNALQAGTTFAVLRFSWMRNHTLSSRLIAAYLRQPYEFFVLHNSADLVKNALTEVQQVVSGVIVHGLQLVARLFLLLLVFATLLWVDPAVAIGVTVAFGGLYGLIYSIARQRLGIVGTARVEANTERFQIATEAFGGVKELKVYGLERDVVASYGRPSLTFAEKMAENAIIGLLPKYALETLAFGSALAIILYQLARGTNIAATLPLLGVYTFAAYRMLPALQTVFSAATTIRFNRAAYDVVAAGLRDVLAAEQQPQSTPAPLDFTRAVTLRDVTFRYATADRAVIENANLTLAPGEWVALVGTTGSGKSTLVDIVLGLLVPQSGSVLVDDVALTAANADAWRRNVGYVPQQIFLADDTIERNIRFGAPDRAGDQQQLDEAVRIAQLGPVLAGLPLGAATVIGERGVRLSGGQRQRIGLARALFRRPRLLILDEATNALDSATEAAVFRELHAALPGVTVVSIAHRLSTTRDFDRVLLIDRGRIVAEGAPADAIGRRGAFRILHAADDGDDLAQPSAAVASSGGSPDNAGTTPAVASDAATSRVERV